MLYGGQFFFDTTDYLVAVFALEHHHYPTYGIYFTIIGKGTIADGTAQAYLGYMLDKEGRGVLAYGYIAYVFKGASHAYSSDKVGIGALVDIGTSCILVVLLQSSENITDTHPHGTEAIGVYNHLILLEFASKAVDFGYSFGTIELASHDPVLHGAEVFGGIFVFALFRRANDILIYLPQSGTHG